MLILWLATLGFFVLIASAPIPLRARIIGGCGIAIIVWLAWGLHGAQFLAKLAPQNIEPVGQFGDSFGGISALFSALAFAGVAVAATLQSEALRVATKQHAQDSFEPLFFQLLDRHRAMAHEIEVVMPNNLAGAGSTYPLAKGAENIRQHLLTHSGWGALVNGSESTRRAELMRLYTAFYDENQNRLGPYFRSLYHLFQLVHDARGLDDGQRRRYAHIARGMLGGEEVFLLALNCISPLGANFLDLVEGYGLLKHYRRDPGGSADEQIISWFFKTAHMSTAQREAYWQRFPGDKPSGF